MNKNFCLQENKIITHAVFHCILIHLWWLRYEELTHLHCLLLELALAIGVGAHFPVLKRKLYMKRQ